MIANVPPPNIDSPFLRTPRGIVRADLVD